MGLHEGSCHCGAIAFTVDADFIEAIDCNCSMCRRRGALLAAVARDAIVLKATEADIGTYQFNKHAIFHRFCRKCGVAPYSEAVDGKMAMVNLRCVPDVDLKSLKVIEFDGASY